MAASMRALLGSLCGWLTILLRVPPTKISPQVVVQGAPRPQAFFFWSRDLSSSDSRVGLSALMISLVAASTGFSCSEFVLDKVFDF